MSFLKDKLAKLRLRQQTGVVSTPLDLDHEELPIITCLNCGTQFRGTYCPHCGQKANTGRLNWSTIADHTLNSIFNLERGFLRTCVDLFYRPGYLMRDYIRGRRTDYNKPIQMLFVLATLHVVVHYIFFQNSGLNIVDNTTIELEEEAAREAVDFLRQIISYFESNKALSTLLFALLLVVPNWLLFKFTEFGKKLNLVEHFYIMTFVGCQLMILNILQIPYARLFNEPEEVSAFFSGYSFFIALWDFTQLYNVRTFKVFRLLIGSSILAFILFILLITAIVSLYLLFHQELFDSLTN